jgi:hypothetical protein
MTCYILQQRKSRMHELESVVLVLKECTRPVYRLEELSRKRKCGWVVNHPMVVPSAAFCSGNKGADDMW